MVRYFLKSFVFVDFFLEIWYIKRMENSFLRDKSMCYNINNEPSDEAIALLGKAIGNRERIRILRALQRSPLNILTLAADLNLPVSTVHNHINVLEEAGLVTVNYVPTKKGHVKICNVSALEAKIEFFVNDKPDERRETFFYEMPIGLFSECDIRPPCGIATASDILHPVDDPRAFFLTERINAQLIWFGSGSISYNFPNYFLKDKSYKGISFRFEICSETYYFNNEWPSDITIFINGRELLTFTSPGDFGGRRGKITPAFWASNSTQFGMLKNLLINEQGVYLDNTLVRSDITYESLMLGSENYIRFGLKIKEDAVHRGGMNLFGKEFGDYPQSIIMTLFE